MKRVIKFIFKRRSIQSKVLTHFGLVILVLFLSLLSVCGVMLHQLTQIEKKVYSVSSINGLLFELVKLESDVTLFNPSHTYETEKKRSLALHEINMKRSKLEHSFILSPNSSLPGYEQAPVKLIKEAIQSHKKKFDNVIAMVRQVQVKKLSFSQEIKAQVQLENLRIDARTDLEKAFAVNEDLLGVLEKDAHVIRLRNFRTLAWLSVLLFAIGAFTFQSLAESFSVPINLLKKFATAVGEGNHVPDLKKSRILEIEDLSQAMNKMAETLEKRTVSQNFLESILEAVLDPIFVINNQGKIKKANRAALRILGTSAPELFQQNLKDYLQSSDGTPLALFHSPGYKVVDLNLLIKSQGGFTPISFSCSPVNKTNEGFVCIARDISEQLLVNEKLVNHQKTIIELSKMSALGEMASGISHEINNPLNVIGSINDLIAFAAESQEYDRPTIIGYTQKIEKMISRISKIIKGLRVFARDGSQDPFQEVSLNTILEDTLELCQSRMKEKEIDFQFRATYQGNVNCNFIQISEVILNLLNNSVDAISELKEKWIEIVVAETASCIEVKITDSGRGIPKEIQNKIFNPFFTTKVVGKGTGLGLSISKGIIEAHGGHFQINNECPNTQFVIQLPKCQNQKKAA